MMYINRNFNASTMPIIEKANEICTSYAAQGYQLTLRQLYYQFVARGILANKQTEYSRLGSIVNDARLAGHLDWNHIEDRTRNLTSWSAFSSPQEAIRAAAERYYINLWEGQENYVEVWVEKEALAQSHRAQHGSGAAVQSATEPREVHGQSSGRLREEVRTE
jgi:hypothetical protein